MTPDTLWSPLDLTDERLRAGFARMREARAAALAGGARPAGWKIGVNDPRVRGRLGLTSSIIGYLLEDGLLSADAPISLQGTTRPGAEIELAFQMRADVAPDADPQTAAAAIGAVAPAIELIDLDPERFTDLTETLARNVWHRAAVLGPRQPWSDDLLDSAGVCVAAVGETQPDPAAPRAAIGDAGALICFVAGATAALGERLRAGDWVLSGLLLPQPLWLSAGDSIRAGYGPLGSLALTFIG